MLFWFVVTVVLLVWNAIYCVRKIATDFRGTKPANGVWGMFALAGVLSAILMALIGVGVAASGI